MKSNQDFQVTKENYTITASLFEIGPDALIIITGGDHPHIGDLSAKPQNMNLETIKYPSHDGRFHKDNLLSDKMAKQISKHVNGSLTVLAGVHVDGITKAQIAASTEMVDSLATQIINWINRHPTSSTSPKYYDKKETPK